MFTEQGNKGREIRPTSDAAILHEDDGGDDFDDAQDGDESWGWSCLKLRIACQIGITTHRTARVPSTKRHFLINEGESQEDAFAARTQG